MLYYLYMDVELNQFLKKVNFDKQFENLIKKLKNKKVVIYGCGQLFQLINEKYDLSKLQILGVSDYKFSDSDEKQKFSGYKIIPKSKIPNYKPDYILIATLNYTDIIKNFDYSIKLKPLVKKGLFYDLKEIWCK